MMRMLKKSALTSILVGISGISLTSCGLFDDGKDDKKKSSAEKQQNSDASTDPEGTNDPNMENPETEEESGNTEEPLATEPPVTGGETNLDAGIPRVEAGGSRTGLLEDGSPYFAGSDTVYYYTQIDIIDNQTTLSGAIYFRNPVTEETLQSALHQGDCSQADSSPYQHITGDQTEGTSQLSIELTGTESQKSGTATAEFRPRDEPLSFVITHAENRYCADLTISYE